MNEDHREESKSVKPVWLLVIFESMTFRSSMPCPAPHFVNPAIILDPLLQKVSDYPSTEIQQVTVHRLRD